MARAANHCDRVTTRGWQWPVFVTPYPEMKSRYLVPSEAVSSAPSPDANSSGVVIAVARDNREVTSGEPTAPSMVLPILQPLLSIRQQPLMLAAGVRPRPRIEHRLRLLAPQVAQGLLGGKYAEIPDGIFRVPGDMWRDCHVGVSQQRHR